MEFNHKSVLLDEVIAGLAIKPDGIYVDGTLVEQDMAVSYVLSLERMADLSDWIRMKMLLRQAQRD